MNTDTTSQAKKSTHSKWWHPTIFSLMGVCILLVGVVAGLLYFPHLYLNDYVKNKIITEFAKEYPEYTLAISDVHIYLLADNIELTSLTLSAKDSSFSCSIDNPSIKGISWMTLIFNGANARGALDKSVATAQNIDIQLPKALYQIHCQALTASLRDALIFAENIEVKPLVDDVEFFQRQKVRTTRYRLTLPQLFIQGETLLGLLKKGTCTADFIRMPELTLDMLVDTSKAAETDSTVQKVAPSPLATMQSHVLLDSIGIDNARITYSMMNSPSDATISGYSIHSKGLRASLHDSSAMAAYLEIQPVSLTDAAVFRCGYFRMSIGDSSLLIREARLLPVLDVDDYFKADPYRRTRLTLQVQELRGIGISYLALIKGEAYRARSIDCHKPVLGIQVSVFKKNKKPTPKSLMPNEMMQKITSVVHIDSIHASDGMIMYEEHYKARSKPAYIAFHRVNVAINSLTNDRHNGDTADVHFNAEFMDGGTIRMNMQLPITARDFSASITGSLGAMKLPKLNTFLEVAENVSIKSGDCQSASVKFNITKGKAIGSIRVLYSNFSLAFLDKKSKSSKGIFNILKSFIANTFTFKSSNKKDSDGIIKLGKITYTRKPTDTFVQVAWFSVRKGIADLIGFPDR